MHSREKRNVFRIFVGAVLVAVVYLLLAIFLPRSYGSPVLRPRSSTRYWNLPTGSRIAYTLISGKGVRKPYPIIFLQGGPGGAIGDENIRQLTPLAEDGYDVYLYDQIGSGLSDRLADIREYRPDRHKRDLEAILKETGSEKVILIGQSWGAILALLFVADNPVSVDKLIFTGPGPIFPIRSGQANVVPPDSLHLREPYYSNRQGSEEANNIRTRVMAFWALQFGKKLASDREADDFAVYLNGLVNRSTVCDTARIKDMPAPAGVGFYAQVVTAAGLPFVRDPRPALLRENLPPLLILKGQCDNQKWGFTKEYLDYFPRHRLVVVPSAGHFINLEQGDRYMAAIRKFLQRRIE